MEKLKDTPIMKFAPEVRQALNNSEPVLALESTVITHGLPYPRNLEIAQELESLASAEGVVPATIVMLDGIIHIGLGKTEWGTLEALSQQAQTDTSVLKKLARRDLALAVAKKWNGGTTVSATIHLADFAGIKVFATGGIGGVHRQWQESFDISADLTALSMCSVIIVTAGCKAILDIPATLEQLETLSVPVLGWQTNYCPAFYTKDTPYPVERADDIDEIVQVWQNNLELSQTGISKNASPAVVVMNPVPDEYSIPSELIEPAIHQALEEAEQLGIKGKATTPFLLAKLAEITKGKSVQANLELLKNNVHLGSIIAKAVAETRK